MEIIDFTQRLGRQVWLLLIIPLIAGGIALPLLLTQPQQYEAKGTVILPLPEEAGSPISGVDQLVSNFGGAVVSDAVVQEVAASLNVPADDIRDGLVTRQSGSSNVVEVSYTTDSEATAVEVLDASIDEALELKTALGSPDAAKLTSDVEARSLSKQDRLIRGLILVVGTAFILAIGLVVLLLAIQQRREDVAAGTRLNTPPPPPAK